MSKNEKEEGQKSFYPVVVYKYINSLCILQISLYIQIYKFKYIMKYIDPDVLKDPQFEVIVPLPTGGGTHNFRGATHFTYVPSRNLGEDWEDVIYLKQRTLRSKDTTAKNKDGGYVYILTNQSWPGVLKIGFTTSEPEKRLSEINNAGSLVDWELGYFFQCKRPYDLEQALHRHLDYCRSRSNREFFEIDMENAISLIENFGQYYEPIK